VEPDCLDGVPVREETSPTVLALTKVLRRGLAERDDDQDV
jgi:hypothetical protein